MKEDVKIFSPYDKSAPIAISLSGVSYCDGSYHILRPASEITVIEYVYSGEGYIMLDGIPTKVGPDTIYVLPAGMNQDYYSSSENPWEKVFMNLHGPLAVSLLSTFFPNQKYIFNGSGFRPLFDAVKDIIFSNLDETIMQSKLYGLYLEILSRLYDINGNIPHTDEAATLKRYIDTNINRPVSNNQLAQQIFRSIDYCIKVFKAAYGTTPYDYQIHVKIEAAKQLLRNTQLPVSNIAAAVGYNDPQYFSNLFKAKCGVSPRAYRKAIHMPDAFSNSTI